MSHLLKNHNEAVRTADRLVRKYGTRNADHLAEALASSSCRAPLSIRRAYTRSSNATAISSSSRTCIRSCTISSFCHEIGHDQLHRSAAIAAGGFQEFNLFNMADRAMEYEANMFAAQVALPDEEILEYIMRGCDVAQIAQLMHSDINLVALKTAELNRQGCRFRQPEHRCDFLK